MKAGETVHWIWEDFGFRIPLEVYEAERGRYISFGGQRPGGPPAFQEVIVTARGGSTVIKVVNSGFHDGAEWDDEYEGVDSGWEMALAQLKEWLENHKSETRTHILTMRPASFEYDDLQPLYTTAEGLRSWLAEEAKLSPLSAYVERMPEDQEFIYYMTGSSREILAGSPQLEAFAEKGIEVILFTDPVDEVWLEQMPPEYKGKKFRSAGRGELELGSEEEKKQAEEERKQEEETYKDLIACLRNGIQDEVKEVRLSSRLKQSPSCLVIEEGDLSPQIEAMLRQAPARSIGLPIV